jgi:hypothetical protein
VSVAGAVSLLLGRQRAEFFASPDTIFEKPIDTYAAGLERDTASWHDLDVVDFPHLIRRLDAFNLAALLCHRTGRGDLAIRLERRAMNMVWRSSEESRWRLHIAQPALNIARVYRAVGLRRPALQIFEALHRVAIEGRSAVVCGLRVDAALAVALREAEPEATRVIRLCREVESLKCALMDENTTRGRAVVRMFGTPATAALALECHLKLDLRCRDHDALFRRIGSVEPDHGWAFVYAVDALLDIRDAGAARRLSRDIATLLERERPSDKAARLLCALALRQTAAGDAEANRTAAAAEELAGAADSDAGRLRALTIRTVAAKRFGVPFTGLAERLWCTVVASRHSTERLFACAAATAAAIDLQRFGPAGASIASNLRPLARNCRRGARLFSRAAPDRSFPLTSNVLSTVVARLLKLSAPGG